jgi:hypothetical protein
MSGSETIAADQLRALADRMDEVTTLLEAAAKTIDDAEVGGAAFSHYGIDMGVAYPSAKAWAARDADSKKTHVESVQDRLRSTALAWDQAEHQSTMSPPTIELI